MKKPTNIRSVLFAYVVFLVIVTIFYLKSAASNINFPFGYFGLLFVATLAVLLKSLQRLIYKLLDMKLSGQSRLIQMLVNTIVLGVFIILSLIIYFDPTSSNNLKMKAYFGFILVAFSIVFYLFKKTYQKLTKK